MYRNGVQQRGSIDPPWVSPRNLGRNLIKSQSHNQDKQGEKSARRQKKASGKNKKVGNANEDKQEEITPGSIA